MRILLHGINYSPELTGIGKYSGEMAEWLAARGHGVRVVTAPPYYPAWRVRTDYRAWSYTTEPGTGSDAGAGVSMSDLRAAASFRTYAPAASWLLYDEQPSHHAVAGAMAPGCGADD